LRKIVPLFEIETVPGRELLMVVILNPVLGGMKNLMISTESTIEILRLSPQNDITTQSPEGEGKGGGIANWG